jgi:prepilin-type processing-associated H-X9-DG protein
VYNTLSFVEQDPLARLGTGLPLAARADALKQLMSSVVPIYNCPSRRNGGPFPNNSGAAYYVGDPTNTKATTTISPTTLARTDYAANAGSQLPDEFSAGPSSLYDGDNTYGWPNPSTYNGIVFLRSEIRLMDVTRGASNTFMVGEKYLNPDNYYTGTDPGDNESMYVGYDNDINRTSNELPLQDRHGLTNTFAFGSAHIGGFNMCYCDGSVRFIEYGIALSVYAPSGSRY